MKSIPGRASWRQSDSLFAGDCATAPPSGAAKEHLRDLADGEQSLDRQWRGDPKALPSFRAWARKLEAKPEYIVSATGDFA